MCTAISLNGEKHYFGRTLDIEGTLGEKIVIVPRGFNFRFLHENDFVSPHALIGVGIIVNNYPLYFDAVNESGLAIAGLEFPKNAYYTKTAIGLYNIASFELIPWILCRCKSVSEARELLLKTNITSDSFSHDLTASELHWIISDKSSSITVEPMRDGIRIHDNPFGVLTNNPPFEYHQYNLSNYMNISSAQPQNGIIPEVELDYISSGLGAVGLPGDYSSPSRFVRAAFVKNHSESMSRETGIERIFNILDTVKVPYGCVKAESGKNRYTVYTACVDTDKCIYYFKTYGSLCLHAVSLYEKTDDVGDSLISFPMAYDDGVRYV